jgi:hypothetical protein
MSELFKLGWLPDEQDDTLSDKYFEYPNIWAREETSGPDRLAVAPE